MSGTARASSVEAVAAGSRWSRRWAAVDALLSQLGDRLNPILVKETRQALKSRQFVLTFALLLLCGWGWSLLGVAMGGPKTWYVDSGREMFLGYYLILAFPLTVMVPFGAFRSLASEQEQRTGELLSITTLGPQQIIRGKLGSAVVQMSIYLSAISPCLGFTYLLGGIDVPTILLLLFYAVVVSLGLSMTALLMATATSEKHWQTLVAVGAVLGLFLVFFFGSRVAIEILDSGPVPFDDAEFWWANAIWLSIGAGYFALFYYAAAAKLAFASDNRSTRLRVVILVQYLLLTGWLCWIWIVEARFDSDVPLIFTIVCGLHWFVMGALMTGETPEMSPRVRRSLPQSLLGRAFLTWFNPGPGTGYLFAVGGLLSVCVLGGIGAGTGDMLRSWSGAFAGRSTGTWLMFGPLGFAYATLFLGLGLLALRALRRFGQSGMLLTALVHFLLLLTACGIPTIIHLMSPTLRNAGYSLLQVANPVWTLIYVADSRGAWTSYGTVLVTVVPLAALVVFGLNLPGVAAEVRRVRIAKPGRIVEDDAALAPPPPKRPLSPWDE
jgi:hypothetical protein